MNSESFANESLAIGGKTKRNLSPHLSMKFKDLTSLDRFKSKLLHNDNKYL